MPHFRVDDALHSHPKAQRAGDEAMGMWTRAGSYCMAYLTNGFVPEWWVKQQPKGTQKARKLVAVGLWHDGAEQDGEKGYQFHEFVGPGRQDSREKIEADRELARKRKEKSRRESQRDNPRDDQRDTPRDGRGESRRKPGYTQPNPTQPITTSGVNSGGELTQVGPPNPHCPRHPDGTDRPCGACAEARRATEDWHAQHLAAELEHRRQAKADRDACQLCDGNGMRELPSGRLARCNHEPVEVTNHAG
ncbi:hypothetical protein [Mycobacterium sp. NPDC050041]|uniref:hypothetical protein n=1 Tax=Mycobacterium sp. NPDC050041 TaxID=3364293 RepID=UPI003C2E8E60